IHSTPGVRREEALAQPRVPAEQPGSLAENPDDWLSRHAGGLPVAPLGNGVMWLLRSDRLAIKSLGWRGSQGDWPKTPPANSTWTERASTATPAGKLRPPYLRAPIRSGNRTFIASRQTHRKPTER